MRPRQHHLRLIDRGPCHRHRYWAQCACGWVGPKRRRRREAKRHYSQHVVYTSVGARRRKQINMGGWRQPTAAADLPELLR